MRQLNANGGTVFEPIARGPEWVGQESLWLLKVQVDTNESLRDLQT